MGKLILCANTAHGVDCDSATATTADILLNKTAGIADEDDIVAGTMPNNTGWNKNISIDEQVLIPKGYHDGSGYVNQGIVNKNAWTSRIGVNGKAVIPAGYHNGAGYVDQAINNRGAVNTTLGINGTYTIPEGYHNGAGKVKQSIATMGAKTVTPGNSQKMVFCSGNYMTGNITVPAVSNLAAQYIKKGVNVGGVVGTWEGYIAGSAQLYNNGAVGQWGITTNNIMESNCIKPLGGYIKTTASFNWTGYKGIKVKFYSENSGTGLIILRRGESISNEIAESDKYSLIKGQWFIIDIPFSQNITDIINLSFAYAGLGRDSYVTEINLY